MRLWYFSTFTSPFNAEMFVATTKLYISFFIAAIFFILLGVAYEYLKKRYRFWSDIRISGPTPTFFIGNMKDCLSLKCTEPEMMTGWYKAYRDKPYIGFYNLFKPSVLIIDPEIIRKVTEVDFNYFIDHPPFSGQSENDAVIKSLFAMKGEAWKLNRAIFSKMFTPKKLRDQAETFNFRYNFLKVEIEKQLELGEDTELCKLVGRYMLTGVTSILYGIDLTKDEQLFQDLEKYSEMFMHPSLFSTFMFLFYNNAPDLFNFLRMRTFPRDFWNYFYPFTKKLLEYNKSQEDANNLLSLLNQYRNSEKPSGISDREAVGHIFSFLAASNHTTVTVLSYLLFMFAQDQEVQDKAREEVDRVVNGNDNISWENVKSMTYLDAVINETMRMRPLLGVLKRVCTKEYYVDENLTIPEGMDVCIPAESLHMDPEHFQEPEKFLPERFLGLEKLPSVFMPFGKGPRVCIGQRMAEISLKIAAARILSDFTILPSRKTTLPIRYDRRMLFITCMPENGLCVKFQRRKTVLSNTS